MITFDMCGLLGGLREILRNQHHIVYSADNAKPQKVNKRNANSKRIFKLNASNEVLNAFGLN